MVITKQLNTFVSRPPYLHDAADKEVVIQGIERVQSYFKNIANMTWITPPSNTTVKQFVDAVCILHLAYLFNAVCTNTLSASRHPCGSSFEPLDW